MSVGDRVRAVVFSIGEVLVTAGIVVLLFIAYEVWFTNYSSERANHRVAQKLQREWQRGDDPLLPLPDGADPSVKVGSGIANLYMPRLGRGYHFAIVEGTGEYDLTLGPGHYAGTALPGKVGNFAVAGHRVGKGEPFLNLDQLRSADAVIVQTRSAWFVYRVLGAKPGADPSRSHGAYGLPGREIVSPDDGQVLDPVPDHPRARATTALMTMTTCHPKFTAAKRMIVYAQLEQTVHSSGTTMPTAVRALYDS